MKSALMCAVMWLLVGCQRAPEELTISGPTMGTTYSVKVASTPEGIDARAIQQATNEILERIDLAMSGYRPDSEISRFNTSSSTDWFDVSADLAKVIDAALKVSRVSNGAFDVTVGPLVAAWGFGAEGEPIDLPDDARLAELSARVGYDKLQARMDAPALRKTDARVVVDLNGIAPGYAVDLLAARLQAMQIKNFMIDIGGEVQAHGRNARGEVWRIAVERPVDKEPEPYAIVQIDDAAVTTSGEYRHYYDRNGQRYSHTIDPRTGRPVQHTLASVVVIGPNSTDIDAWATAFNVLGSAEGMVLAGHLDMPVLFIEAPQEAGGELRSLATAKFARYIAQK